MDKDLVYKLLKQVPRGKVTTYKALASAVGHPRAARAIGAFMRSNPYAPWVPCHRVVGSDGTLTGYSGAGGISTKAKILAKEGVAVKNNRIVDLGRHYFRSFSLGKARKEILP